MAEGCAEGFDLCGAELGGSIVIMANDHGMSDGMDLSPNPPFESDAAKALRASTTRWASSRTHEETYA